MYVCGFWISMRFLNFFTIFDLMCVCVVFLNNIWSKAAVVEYLMLCRNVLHLGHSMIHVYMLGDIYIKLDWNSLSSCPPSVRSEDPLRTGSCTALITHNPTRTAHIYLPALPSCQTYYNFITSFKGFHLSASIGLTRLDELQACLWADGFLCRLNDL